MQWILLIAGGILGTLCRFLLSTSLHRWTGGADFPYGTLAVNMIGCLAAGFIGGLADQRGMLTPQARLFCMVGFLGAFTTFSALIYESGRLLQDGQALLAGINVFGSVAVGFAALWFGLFLSSLL